MALEVGDFAAQQAANNSSRQRSGKFGAVSRQREPNLKSGVGHGAAPWPCSSLQRAGANSAVFDTSCVFENCRRQSEPVALLSGW